MSTQKASQLSRKLHVKVSFGLDEVPQEFNLQKRMMWKYKSKLEAIRAQTGAEITFGGLGSGQVEAQTGVEAPESLHIRIQHPSLKALQVARQMAEGLVETVRQDFEEFQQEQQGNVRQFPSAATKTSGGRNTSYHFSSRHQLTVGERSQSPASDSTLKKTLIEGTLDTGKHKKSKPNEEQETNLRSSKWTSQASPVYSSPQRVFKPSFTPSNASFPQPTTTKQHSASSEEDSTDVRNTSLPTARPFFSQKMKLLENTISSRIQPDKMPHYKGFTNENVELENSVQLSTRTSPHFTVASNQGPIKIMQSPKGDKSLYASLANHLFGPFRTLQELALSADTLHRRAINYVRKQKELFLHQVINFYSQVHPDHGLDDDMVFECACVVLCETNRTPFEGQKILLVAIATLFSSVICIHEEVSSLSKDNMLLAQNRTVVCPIHTVVTEFTLNVLKRQIRETHYDSILFLSPQKPIAGHHGVSEMSEKLYPSKS